MKDHSEALRAAADEYRREVERAKEIRRQSEEVQRQASDKLAAVMRAAYADKVKIAAIIRYADHVWSRTWVEKAVKPTAPNPTET